MIIVIEVVFDDMKQDLSMMNDYLFLNQNVDVDMFDDHELMLRRVQYFYIGNSNVLDNLCPKKDELSVHETIYEKLLYFFFL